MNSDVELTVHTAADFFILQIYFSEIYKKVSAVIEYEYSATCINFELLRKEVAAFNRSTLRSVIPSSLGEYICYCVTTNNGSKFLTIQGSSTIRKLYVLFISVRYICNLFIVWLKYMPYITDQTCLCWSRKQVHG